MARMVFGGSSSEVFLVPDAAGALHPTGNSVALFYTAQSGGSLITDLLDMTGAAISSVTTADGTGTWAAGQLPQFQGPDGVFEMWCSVASSPRTLIRASMLGSAVAGPTAASLATHTAAVNPHSSTLASLSGMDATVGSAATGAVLQKTTTGWGAATISSGGSTTLAGLTDVDDTVISAPTGTVLTRQASGSWAASAVTAAGDTKYNVKDYGAKGDDATDDLAAITNAVAAIPAAGGVLYFPAGVYRVSAAIDVSEKRGITIRGDGGRTAGLDASTVIKTTSATADIITAKHHMGLQVRDLELTNTNVAWTGAMLNLAWNGTSAGAYNNVRNVLFWPASGQTGGCIGVDLNWCLDSRIESCHFGAFVSTGSAVRGRADATAQSNGISIVDCVYRTSVSVRNPGQAWTIQSCVFEGNPTTDVAGAVLHDAGVLTDGLTIAGCWLGDITSGTQIQVAGTGINITGNWIGATTATAINIDETSSAFQVAGNKFVNGTFGLRLAAGCSNYKVENNLFTGQTTAIDMTTSGGHTNYKFVGNQFTSVTTTNNGSSIPAFGIDDAFAGPGIRLHNNNTANGNATIRYTADRTTVQTYDLGIDPLGATSKAFELYDRTRSASVFKATKAGSVILNSSGAALATTATDGYTYIPTVAGAPTGVPTAQTGTVAMVYDTTNNKLWIYNGAWKGVVLA